MYEIIAFYVFATLTIGMFGIVVMSSNALYAMSALAGGMIFISGFFFILDAEFLGVVQIVVYSGAIMALYAFGMMFFDTTRDVSEKMRSKKIAYTLSVISAILVVTILCAPLASEEIEAMYPSIDTVGNVQMIGVVLFTKYLVPFELAAIMLLVAMIAGIVLASKRMDEYLAMEENEIEYPKETK
ncbi:NADH-quinone oxidoreductase subunit J [Sulfurospirillum diekertiae]|jgi:NADH-quinone oxidoreductase subunit J|uniref:NADH-quinone oxidoreductase subunit J n=1 Tax=Sulfurospirillum diekertiae TaxID=1854492 RepID=A0A1Y0HJC2_9BACT|nr:NADH-quinone oxidoreductase subunit J [Sulfurospirillum diekertiae]ARU47363.1 NADH-quinone oxidoreductase subunit J [Sulfurospirillum diekertiae]ASC92214.1 NADH-quinone oxidoreductase subunit J [Sulfurospirillum diekertiae]ATB68308.1 NADH-ubiquinone oxidoreductase chain J [Sulfurospirillum diekertiae]QIR76174.1 NADH-quinone oxidoreductase subunit J [Sulfurospirillum diekertiae]QIR78807.1 NADH-quinone oxidoreductase subunit J [Sulfurospirillum diekertiae]